MLAEINGVDITKHMLASTYDVSSEEESYDWKDGNHVRHKDFLRNRITGSFSLKFRKGTTDYTDFLALLESVKKGNKISITVFVSNLNTVKTINAYYAFRPVVRKDVSEKVYESFLFSLEEE